ncbi:hypothetical protein MKW98_021752 [Papaver atlanticum]|uniref:Uncharacterized protein n=1 Tax=Papaver atlanticum TaxID=357466 RepID=A0AAD4XH61_9MAGN|nr:hypothetical protein MKW98_021752 [Papaver atlanticum]
MYSIQLPTVCWLLGASIAGADPNLGGDGVKALIVAAEVGAIEIIKVEAGAAPNVTKTVRGTTQIIKLLVEAGADPNVTNIVSTD